MIPVDDIFGNKKTKSSTNNNYNNNFESKLRAFTRRILDEEFSKSAETRQKEMFYFGLMNKYLARYGKSVYDDYSDIVKIDFEVFDNLDKKIQILQDALENGILLEDSKFYVDILERVIIDEDDFKTDNKH